ncbi:DUF3223 domain-containing protein [Rugamonas sp. CCM 8940]|uniref:DUF3223 domain-containing protein n=1 Tax=Rugamonas sp. CCM 8940 TaxID=2765359 RepID=UPI0018F737C2|nr:DUF3223 domain-containing protein [Rugamonas sp. CCM 8940]MBJ7312688.1 DUF3223 domain-containing protein [Rugamonas sp. CCM 8940]
MGKAISVTVNGQVFQKKGDLTLYMRSLVGKYRIGDFLTVEDLEFCLSLFESHPSYPHKLSPGVERIQVLVQEKGTVGFQIHKCDGKDDDISWTECVRNRK